MKKANQKKRTYPTEAVEQFRKKIVTLRREWPEAHEIAEHLELRSPEIDEWAREFFKKELPLLRELWLKYKIAPAEIVGTVALWKLSPVANSYPERLRRKRPKARLAAQLKKAADAVRLIRSVSCPVWSIDVLDHYDIALEYSLDELAQKVRALRTISGRPEKRMLRECACDLEKIFREHTQKGKSLYLRIAEILRAAWPDQWTLHGKNSGDIEKAEINAVKDLLRPRHKATLDQLHSPKSRRRIGYSRKLS
jgi:hypothetical protein